VKESIPTAMAMKRRACVRLSAELLPDSGPKTGAILAESLGLSAS
jgi:hypothetical protein